MTLIEALKSGKNFRLGDHGCELSSTIAKHYKFTYSLTQDEILSDDWQVIEPKVTITREQLMKAWIKAFGVFGQRQYIDLSDLAKELGL